MRLVAAVVDHHDMRKARADQALGDSQKTVIRVQRRQDDRHGFQAGYLLFHFFLLR